MSVVKPCSGQLQRSILPHIYLGVLDGTTKLHEAYPSWPTRYYTTAVGEIIPVGFTPSRKFCPIVRKSSIKAREKQIAPKDYQNIEIVFQFIENAHVSNVEYDH